jgi:murein tripeptide amidase MpaA
MVLFPPARRGLPGCTLRFLNAGECAYPEGWTNYQLMASYDRINWFRVPHSTMAR